MISPLSPGNVIEALGRLPVFTRSLLDEFEEDRLDRLRGRPAPKKWSAHGHAYHLAEVHPLFFDRIDTIPLHEHPTIEPYFPDKAHEDGMLLDRDLTTEMTRFESDRRRPVEKLRALEPEDWRRTAAHAEYRRYDLFVMVRHLAMHDLFRAYRIEEPLLAHD
ncbi:MAG: DinB family protein [Acidobacteriota bacterium]